MSSTGISGVASGAAEAPGKGELLALHGVSKSFDGRPVLEGVSLTVSEGRILGLAGENGAGKSTLLKIAAGLESPDEGSVAIGGEPTVLRDYADAMRHGISMVFQEQALVPQLPVYENLFLGSNRRFSKGGVLRTRAMKRRADELFERFGIHRFVRSDRLLGEYDFGRRQLIEIVRAFAVAEVVGVAHPIVLLDEATAALNDEERQVLFSLIRTVRGHAALVFVSHLLGELLEVCDDIVVLKDGRAVASEPASALDTDKLHQLITGRERPAAFYLEDRQRAGHGEVAIEAHELVLDGQVDRVSLDVRRGEVVGIAGVVGSGKEAVGRLLAGLLDPDDGTVTLPHGSRVGYVPKERLAEGILPEHPVTWNASLAGLWHGKLQRHGVLQLGAEKRWAREMADVLDVRPRNGGLSIGKLSGGNQQKVVIGRWTLVSPSVLVLDNPTRGVDVGSRHAIYRLLRDLADDGMAIVVISDDLLEVIGLADRILAMRDRRVVAQVVASTAAKPSERELIQHLV